jgi:hypothetical protein
VVSQRKSGVSGDPIFTVVAKGLTPVFCSNATRTPGLAEHPLWSSESARGNHPASDGELIQEEAASIAALQAPADALVDVIDAGFERSETEASRVQILSPRSKLV